MSLFVLGGSASRLIAQIDTGSIQGFISDASGAAITGAAAEAQSNDTGLVTATRSDREGRFVLTALKVGSYTVRVNASGFDPVIRNGITVAVQSTVDLDLQLKPGNVQSTVEVASEAPVTLQTQDASVGQVVSGDEIENLPLNGRNYTLLAQLAPGTTTTYYDSGHGEVQSGSFTANGMVTVFNNYMLDGISNNNMTADFGNGNSFTLKPPPEGLAEFKVETANYSAEYGRSGGAVVNAVTQSGSNHFFGALWEFNRNSYFDSEDYFLKQANLPRPKYNRNQFGGSFGGPIRHDKTFFFVDYEGLRIRQGQAYTSSVPTASERSSGYTNFTDLLTYQSGTQTDILGRTTHIGQVFDPATTRYLNKGTADPLTGIVATSAGYVREPFAGNIVPQNRLSPVAVNLLNFFPGPNTNHGNISSNFASAPILQQSGDSFDSRVDQNFSSHDQLFARGSYGLIPRVIPAPCGTLALCGTSATVGNESDVILGVAVGETHTFSPNLINELRIGYNRIHMNRLEPYGSQGGLNAANGIPGIPDGPGNGGLTQIKISGLAELGEHNNIPLDEIGSESVYNENTSLNRRNHIMRFGVSYERLKNAIYSAQFPHGNFGFSGTYTDLPSGNTANTGIAQFVIEPIPSTVPNCTVIQAAGSGKGCQTYNYVGGSNQIQGSPLSQQDYRRPYFGTYFTDTWTVTRNLTASLGLRWEYFEVGTDHQGHAANFVPSFASGDGSSMYLIDDRSKNIPLSPSFTALMAQEKIAIVYSSNHQLQQVPEKNFSPRIGLAWNFRPTSVLRAGYGIFYAGIYARGDGYNPGDDYPFTFSVNITSSNQGGLASDSGNTIGPLEKGLSSVPMTPANAQGYQISPRGIMYHTHIPYVQAMNLSLQQQITRTQYFQLAYVGTMSRHIESNIQSNQADVLLPPNVSLSPVSASPTCNEFSPVAYQHDGSIGATSPATPAYYDQYPCLAQKNYYMWLEGSNNYNSLQTKYQKTYRDGTSLIFSYTWEKLLGYASDSNLFNSLGYRAPLVPGFGMKGEYGNVDFESENIFHAGGIWDLPFGYGRKWLTRRGLLETIAGGWNMTGIFTYQSGQPISISCATTTSSSIGCYALANKSAIYSRSKTVQHWFNPAAFSDPGKVQTIGQSDFSPLGSKPGQGFGPSFHRGDLGIQKVFTLTEKNTLKFRAESFNLTNSPNFGQPGTLTYTSSAFAQITGTRDAPSDARELQFSLEFNFGN